MEGNNVFEQLSGEAWVRVAPTLLYFSLSLSLQAVRPSAAKRSQFNIYGNE
jgi:hypothetical protein